MSSVYISNVITVCNNGTVALLDGRLLHVCDLSVWRYPNGDVIEDGLSGLIKWEGDPKKFVFISTDCNVYLVDSRDLFDEYDGYLDYEDKLFRNVFHSIIESLRARKVFPFKCKML